jgi:hypothetical protein
MANAIQMDFRTTYSEINGKIQKAKENFEVQQIEADELRRKMLVGFMRNTVGSNKPNIGYWIIERLEIGSLKKNIVH